MSTNITCKIEPVIAEVKKKTGINIENLKPAFLERRINYRIRTLGMDSFDEYLRFLINDDKEAKNLYRAFSINVTKFYRDPIVWERISKDILPKLYTDMRFSPILAWSCGCASGEEPYTISMMLTDFAKKRNISHQITATDINQDAIDHAKNGLYIDANLVNVKPEIRLKYFETSNNGKYEVKQEIRKSVEFSRIDMMKNTGKLYDIIFCRNVLIYYDKDRHEEIFKKFHSSLKRDGYLVLGQDESMIGTKGSEHFELLSPKERIYQKLTE